MMEPCQPSHHMHFLMLMFHVNTSLPLQNIQENPSY